MTVIGPGGDRDQRSDGDAARAAAANDGQSADEGLSDQGEPVELTEEFAQLDLEDDDPPLPWLQGDDDDEEFEGPGIGQTIAIVLLGLLALGTVAGGIWWFTRDSADDVLIADGGTVKAPDAPYKQKPADPGGKVFEGTGDTSFGISEGQKRPARLGEEAAAVAKPSAAPADKPAPAASGTATPADTSGVGVQVAAYSNQEQAEAGWTNLSGKYEALSGLKHRVVQGQADIGTVYRLQAVAGDAAAAKALCQKLKAAGLNCQVKN